MSNPIRSFIALYPDPEAKAHMAEFISRLRDRNHAVRWEHPDKVHITLKFLGDVEAATLDTIISDLRTQINTQSIISSTINRSGAFPNFHRARIVWRFGRTSGNGGGSRANSARPLRSASRNCGRKDQAGMAGSLLLPMARARLGELSEE